MDSLAKTIFFKGPRGNPWVSWQDNQMPRACLTGGADLPMTVQRPANTEPNEERREKDDDGLLKWERLAPF